jgi:hypothetical protein
MHMPVRSLGGVLGMIAMATFAVVGCDRATDELPREPASGTVTFDGRPLESGTIQFQPASQTEGIASGGTISAGRFDIPRAQGPVPGKYHVAIFAAASTQSGSADGEAVPIAKRDMKKQIKDLRGTVPPRYNVQTELVAEVKAGEPNTYKFDLKK